MALVWRGLIGRGMARTAGQVVMSVLATLIATSLYSELRHGYETVMAVTPPPSPPLTSGGKYGTRIEGAVMPPLPTPAWPVLGMVNWPVMPQVSVAMIPDPGSVSLSGATVGEGAPATELRPPRRAPHRSVVAAVVPPTVKTAPSPAPVASLVVLPVVAAAPEPSFLSSASAAMGATVHAVAALGGSALASGGNAVSHLLPWSP